MTRRVLVLVVGHLAIAGGLLAASGHVATGAPLAILGFAFAFALVGLAPMHLELGRHACTVTLVEAVLVAALFNLPPVGVIVAAAAGELIAVVASRQRPLKMSFNVAATTGTVAIAASTFALGGSPHAGSVGAWLWALLAAAAYGFANHASTSAVLMVVERQPFYRVFLASVATAGAATIVGSTIGMAAVALHALHPFAPGLLVPLVGLVVIETRRMAAHRAEHLRFERLYLASRETGRLQGIDDALATLARASRQLVTGAVGICCSQDRHGLWRGVLIDDLGDWPAPAEVVAAARQLAEDATGEVTASALPPGLAAVAPSVASAVVARSDADSVAPVVLVVLREIGGEDGHASRASVLGAFAGHAALTVANARLYAEVEEALRHQLDLNRQKDDFVAVVSHELRTPLTSLLGSVRTLRRLDGRLAADRRERMLEISERQGARLQRLIEDLLAVAAADDDQARGAVETVPFVDLVAELVVTLGGAGGDRVAVQIEPAMATLLTDGAKLGQLVFNLIENATKYAPGGPIEVVAQLRRGAATISVIDHGPGIAPADRDRAFERFVQLDQSSTREKGGTGLGLYLCRRLAHVLGGRLELSDTPGGGCTFTIALPGSVAAGQPDRAIASVPAWNEDGHMDGTVLISGGAGRPGAIGSDSRSA